MNIKVTYVFTDGVKITKRDRFEGEASLRSLVIDLACEIYEAANKKQPYIIDTGLESVSTNPERLVAVYVTQID